MDLMVFIIVVPRCRCRHCRVVVTVDVVDELAKGKLWPLSNKSEFELT